VWWYTLVIPGIQKAEVRRIMVGGQLRQRVGETFISINKWGEVVHACSPSYLGSIDRRIAV
jgi:hypothetical protein